MTNFKQNLGAILVVGSLILGCSSTDKEFKPSNDMEKQAYDFLKEKYPNYKIVSYDYAFDFYEKAGKNKNWIEEERHNKDKFEILYDDTFSGSLYAEINNDGEIRAFYITCVKNKKCDLRLLRY